MLANIGKTNIIETRIFIDERRGGMRTIKIIFVAAMFLVITSCTFLKYDQLFIVQQGDTADVPFQEKKNGRVTVVYNASTVDFVVSARGLQAGKGYNISVADANEKGVMFGPKENVVIRLGTIEDETIFKSNGKGNLFVSMINPVRIAEAREMVLQIKAADGTEIIKSRPFRLEN